MSDQVDSMVIDGLCANCEQHFASLDELLAHVCTSKMDALDERVRRMPVMQKDYPASPAHMIVSTTPPTVDQTPMSIGEIMATLKAINPEQRLLVRLPHDVIEYIAPYHAELMKAVTRYEKRTAWRKWRKAIETLHKGMRASAQEAN